MPVRLLCPSVDHLPNGSRAKGSYALAEALFTGNTGCARPHCEVFTGPSRCEVLPLLGWTIVPNLSRPALQRRSFRPSMNSPGSGSPSDPAIFLNPHLRGAGVPRFGDRRYVGWDGPNATIRTTNVATPAENAIAARDIGEPRIRNVV